MMPRIREALACLQYGIAARKGFVVMTEKSAQENDSAQDRPQLVYQGSRFNGLRL